MKIALIGTTAGCVIGFRADLIKALVKLEHTVYAFALDYNDKTKKEVETFGAIPVSYSLNRGGLNPISDIISTYKLSKILRSISPDLVFSYFAKPVIFGTLAAVLAGVKRRIGMLEGLGYFFTLQPKKIGMKTRILRYVQIFLYRFTFYFLDKLIFLNPDDPLDLLKKNKLKVKSYVVLGAIGLDLKKFPYTEPNVKRISFIFIGRLLAEKGVNEFIAAAKIVKVKYSDVDFVLVGGLDQSNPGGLSSSELKELIKDSVVIYSGQVSDVNPWLAESSVFVLPSYREGLPRSTQEAMATGRPIITTDVPGCRETVINGLNGFLVPPFNPASLADRMMYFVENPQKIIVMGLESYRLAQEKFDGKKANEKLISHLLFK
jgi:glycosyltransferase involved in cell wall biosynthesis